MNNLTHDQIAEYLISYILDELVETLVQEKQVTLEQALKIVYNSHTLQLLQQKEDELYIQSPAYIYELLQQELNAA